MVQRKATKKSTVKKPAVKRTTKKPAVKNKAAELVAGVSTLHDEALVAGVSTLHDEALELAESVLFMAQKLKESRELMINEPLIIGYDNGGGQKGIRENPHYVAFEHLMTTYTKSLRQLSEVIEKGAPARKASSIMAELTDIAGRKIG